MLSTEEAKAYVKRLEASDVLIEAALRVPVPDHRRTWSGLVEQQALFHRRLP